MRREKWIRNGLKRIVGETFRDVFEKRWKRRECIILILCFPMEQLMDVSRNVHNPLFATRKIEQ